MNMGKSLKPILIVLSMTASCWAQPRIDPAKVAQWPDKVKVAAVQTGGHDKWLKIKDGCDPVASVVTYIERAAADGVQLVVFPEYHLGRISVPGAQTRRISQAAAKHGIYVIGVEIIAERRRFWVISDNTGH